MNPRLRRPAGALVASILAASGLGAIPSAQAVIAGGTISGTITGTSGPLENVGVDVYDFENGYWGYTSAEDDYATTDVNGSYVLNLPPGEYRIGFNDYSDHVEEFYDDAPDVDVADTITVTEGGDITADAELATASHVTGTVTGPDGLAVWDVNVGAYEEITYDDGYTEWRSAGNGWTDEFGNYDIGGLAPGTYRIGFDPSADTGLAPEYYEDQPSVFLAQDVEVGAVTTLNGIDAELASASQITGTVTDVNDAPLADATVYAVITSGEHWDYVSVGTTDANGSYTLDRLPKGAYWVEFNHEAGEEFLYEYWNNSGSFDEAQAVTVGTDVTVDHIDAKLVAGEFDTPYVEGVTLPVVSGTPQVGSTLTATAGTWNPAGITATYQWFRGEQAIAGATASSYTLTTADQGQYIWVGVVASYPGYEDRFNMSATVGPVTAAPGVAPVPVPVVAPAPAPAPAQPSLTFPEKIKVKGTLKVGKKLVLRKYAIAGLGTEVTYKFRWYAGKKKIKKATKSKLKLTRALKGKKISVKVTAKAGSASKTLKIKVGKVR